MTVLSTLQKLPEICAARLPTTGEPICSERGVMGYYSANPAWTWTDSTGTKASPRTG